MIVDETPNLAFPSVRMHVCMVKTLKNLASSALVNNPWLLTWYRIWENQFWLTFQEGRKQKDMSSIKAPACLCIMYMYCDTSWVRILDTDFVWS